VCCQRQTLAEQHSRWKRCHDRCRKLIRETAGTVKPRKYDFTESRKPMHDIANIDPVLKITTKDCGLVP